MTTLFLVVCAVSVIFFLFFLLKCSAPTHQFKGRSRTSGAPVVRKIAEAQAVDSACGRRFFVHLEGEMAEFLSSHGRYVAMLLVAMFLLPMVVAAQDTAGPSPDELISAADPS